MAKSSTEKPGTIPVEPGPRDLITDVGGLRVGNAEDEAVRSGVSVILPEAPCVMGVDVRGGAPGTRETEALDPACLVEAFHGLVLAGGSVFGLAAAEAVVDWLSARSTGLALGPRAIPVVPAAILFDLANGGDKAWEANPYRRLAIEACETCQAGPDAGGDFALGRAGAGFGAMAGDRPGGLGSASARGPGGLTVGALVAVNSFGAAGAEATAAEAALRFPKAGLIAANTTIGAVATNLAVDKAGARRIAIMAHDGLARTIRPLHTPFDGDTVFAMSTGALTELPGGLDGAMAIALAGAMAADCLARAVEKALA